MKNWSLFLMICGLLLGCKQEETIDIEKSEMIKIITDMRIAKATSDRYSTAKRDSIRSLLENKVYEIYQIDSIEYGILLGALIEDSELFFEVEEGVQMRLGSMMKSRK